MYFQLRNSSHQALYLITNFIFTTVSSLDFLLLHILFLSDQAPMPRPTTSAHPAATGTRVIAISCEGGAVEG